MKIRPKKSQVSGRIVEIETSMGGIVLPESQLRGTSKLVLIDVVGPDVKDCKVGDIVVPKHLNFIYLRGGTHWVIFAEEDIVAGIEEVPMENITIDGKPVAHLAAQEASAS